MTCGTCRAWTRPSPMAARSRSCRPWPGAESGLGQIGSRKDEVGLMARYESVLGLIGETPLVEISALSPNPDARLFIKLEGQNPGGSVKDRVALSMIEIAESDGILKPGQPDQILMEPSSGNTGIGLAMVCKV